MTMQATTAASRVQPSAQVTYMSPASASDVARNFAEQNAKKVKDSLHVPEGIKEIASVLTLQESNLRALELGMKLGSGAGKDVFGEHHDTDISGLVLGSGQSEKEVLEQRAQEARQNVPQDAGRRTAQAQAAAACAAYRTMQSFDSALSQGTTVGSRAGGIITVTA